MERLISLSKDGKMGCHLNPNTMNKEELANESKGERVGKKWLRIGKVYWLWRHTLSLEYAVGRA